MNDCTGWEAGSERDANGAGSPSTTTRVFFLCPPFAIEDLR